MTQNQPDPTAIIADAAAHIKAGTLKDDTIRLVAAGHAAQRAADSGDTELLDLLILLSDGQNNDALHLLVNRSIPNGQQSTSPAGAFAGLINAGSATTAPQRPARPSSAPAAGGGRRAQRPVS